MGDGESVLVGPDNGLLAPAVAMVGGATRAVELTSTEYRLEAPGPHLRRARRVRPGGRPPLQRRAPRGARSRDRSDHACCPGILPLSREEDGGIVAEVLWVDRFGNAQLNVDPDELEPFGERVRVVIGESARSGRRVRAFADAGPGEIGLIIDSYGLVAVVLDRRSAAEELGLDAGSGRCGSSPSTTTAPTPFVAPPSSAPSDCPAAQEPHPPHETRHHHRARRPARS